jgi:hypothetical protein
MIFICGLALGFKEMTMLKPPLIINVVILMYLVVAIPDCEQG